MLPNDQHKKESTTIFQAAEELCKETRLCAGPLKSAAAGRHIEHLLELGRDDEAAAFSKTARVFCGQDLNPVFLKQGRFDGQFREYECPKCGVLGIFKLPKLETVK